MKKIFFTISILTIIQVKSQNIISNRFYTDNYSILNPSCIFLYEFTSISLFSHQQWMNVKNHPYTQGIVANGIKDQAGWGIHLLNNRWGNINNFSLRLNYAYRAKINEEFSLSSSLSFSMNQFSLNQSNYTPTDVNDPALSYTKESSIIPNFNFGVVLHSNNAHIGFAVLNVLQNNYNFNINEDDYNEVSRYILLHGYYIIKISDNLDFKPSLLFLKNSYQKINGDFGITTVFDEKYSLGISYATYKEFSITAGLLFKQYSFTYSFGFNTFLKSYLNSTFHELSIGYRFNSVTNSQKLL